MLLLNVAVILAALLRGDEVQTRVIGLSDNPINLKDLSTTTLRPVNTEGFITTLLPSKEPAPKPNSTKNQSAFPPESSTSLISTSSTTQGNPTKATSSSTTTSTVTSTPTSPSDSKNRTKATTSSIATSSQPPPHPETIKTTTRSTTTNATTSSIATSSQPPPHPETIKTTTLSTTASPTSTDNSNRTSKPSPTQPIPTNQTSQSITNKSTENNYTSSSISHTSLTDESAQNYFFASGRVAFQSDTKLANGDNKVYSHLLQIPLAMVFCLVTVLRGC